MNSAIRALLLVVGGLLIVGATVIFLREMGTVLPPRVSAALSFVVGVGMLWAAFHQEHVSPEVRKVGQNDSGDAEAPYDRAALARLQEAFDSDAKPSDPSL